MAEFRTDILTDASKQFHGLLANLPVMERRRYFAAFVAVAQRLRRDPFDFGEELYDLKSLGMQMRLGVQLPLAVVFGADAANRIAVIHSISIMDRP